MLTGVGAGVGTGEGGGVGTGAGGVIDWDVAHPAIIITTILNRTIPVKNLFFVMLTSFLLALCII